LILLTPKDSGTAVACQSASSCGWWWWTDEEDGKRKQFRWGTTGKKTDNRDFAIKNPDKRGAENNENDLDSIERSVKDDDPAKAGFFFWSPDSSTDSPASPIADYRRAPPGTLSASRLSSITDADLGGVARDAIFGDALHVKNAGYSQFPWQPTTGFWITKLKRLREAGIAMMMKMPATKLACNFVSATRRPASSDS